MFFFGSKNKEDAPTNTENTQIKQSIILNQTQGWWATISDWMTTFIFGGNPKYSVINKNNLLSARVTSLFNNTEVDVYIFDSKLISCFAMVGQSFTASPLWTRLRNSKIGSAIQFIGSFEKLIQLIQIKGSKSAGNVDRLVFDNITNKFNINIPNITIYMSSAMVELLDNDDQIIAIILSEIGQNLQLSTILAQETLHKLSMFTGGMAISGGIYKIVSDYLLGRDIYSTAGKFLGFNNIEKMIINALLSLAIVCMFCMYLSMYMSRRARINADFFAAKVGYGKAFYEAIKKVQFDNTSSLTGMNIFDRLLSAINKSCAFITDITATLGLSSQVNRSKRSYFAKQNYLRFADDDEELH